MFIWSLILSAIGIFGLYLVGNKKIAGWYVGIAAQFLWFTYAIATAQWGFILACIAYGWVNYRNLRAWRNA